MNAWTRADDVICLVMAALVIALATAALNLSATVYAASVLLAVFTR